MSDNFQFNSIQGNVSQPVEAQVTVQPAGSVPAASQGNVSTTGSVPAVSPGSVPAVSGGFSIKSLNLAAKSPFIVVGETGLEVPLYPFERIRFETDKNSRISILSDEVIVVKIHYTEDLRYFFCSGGKCCDYAPNSPSIRYLYPVVQYVDTNEKGRVLSDQVRLKLLQLNNESYRSICAIQEHKGNLSQYDLVVSCSDAKFQKISFTEAGPAYWQSRQGIIQFVTDYMNKHGKDILQGVAREVPDYEFDQMMGLGVSVKDSLHDVTRI